MICPFCNPSASEVVLENETSYARWDRYPVAKGHLLVLPKRHVATYFDLPEEESRDLWRLVSQAKEHVDGLHHPVGYNVGINVGEAAGQTIFHLHVHLIPRWHGDVPKPRGGVRHVIPGKGDYP